jgi:hypothetical protein
MLQMAHGEHIRYHAILPADLYESAKDLAYKEGGRSLASLIREALEERVKREKAAA